MSRMSVDDAAARMGKSPMFVRMWLRSGKCPFGHAELMPGGRWSYYINPVRFERYLTGVDLVVAASEGR